VDASSCLICDKDCTSGSVLTNGSRYHDKCYVWLCQRESRVSAETYREQEAQAGLVAAVSRFIGLSSGDKLTALTDERERLRKLLWRIHTFWPSYPPDWEDRRKRLFREQPYCEDCCSTEQLQVHHRTPLSRGGSNILSNLAVLCQRCHSSEHGGRTLGLHPGRTNHIQRNLQLIQNAIATKQKLRFTYTKYGERGERRIVTPYRIVRYEHKRKEGYTLCLEGLCHKRNADRVFKIKTITRMELL